MLANTFPGSFPGAPLHVLDPHYLLGSSALSNQPESGRIYGININFDSVVFDLRVVVLLCFLRDGDRTALAFGYCSENEPSCVVGRPWPDAPLTQCFAVDGAEPGQSHSPTILE